MPAIPTIKSKDSVMGAANALDRSYSNVRATPDMFGAMEGRALSSAGKAIGDGLASLSAAFKEHEQLDRNEKVVAADASNPLTPTAMEAQQNAPADGSGLVESTRDALKQKIDTQSEELQRSGTLDAKGAQQWRIRKYGEMDKLVTHSSVTQFNMRLQYSKDSTNTALNTLDNTLRTNPSAYDETLRQGNEMIDASIAIPAADKVRYKETLGRMYANTRFEGMLTQAKTVEDIDSIQRELETPEADGSPNKWQKALTATEAWRESPYEKLMTRVRVTKTAFGQKAHIDAKAELDRLEKISEDPNAQPIDADTLRHVKALTDQAGKLDTTTRLGLLAAREDVKSTYRLSSPQTMQRDANTMRGGVAGMYPGVPADVARGANVAAQSFPGVSPALMAATAKREYGGNFVEPKPTPGKTYVPSVLESAPGVGSFRRGSANAAHKSEFWGDPDAPDFAQKHLAPITSPSGKTAQVSKAAAPYFQAFINELEQRGYSIKDFGGHNNRDIRGRAGIKSQHAYGNAIDINPAENPMGSPKNALPPDISDLAAKYGLVWGGDWRGRKDAMHFEWSGYVTAAGAQAASQVNGAMTQPKIDYSKTNATTGAQGLYQFKADAFEETAIRPETIAAVRANTGIDMATMTPEQRSKLRANPEVSAIVAGARYAQSKKTMEQQLQRPISDAELYMSHFMGTTGSVSFLSAYKDSPQTLAKDVLPKAAESNPNVFYVKGDETKPLTVKQVYDKITLDIMASPSRASYERSRILSEQAEARSKAVQANPQGAATSAGIIAQAPLTNEPNSWAARGSNISRISQWAEMPTEDVKPFDTQTEEQSIRKQFEDGSAQDIVALLGNMSSMEAVAPGSMKAALKQTGQEGTAYGIAGELVRNGDAATAMSVVTGAKRLQEAKDTSGAMFKSSGGAGATETWNKEAGYALRGASPQYSDALYQAAKAHYIATTPPSDKGFDPKAFTKSINAVLGQEGRIAYVNGDVTVLPRGVNVRDMNEAVYNLHDADLIKLAVGPDGKPSNTPPMYSDGSPVAAHEIYQHGKLEFIGMDTYRVRMGDDRYAITPDGGAYAMRLDQKAVASLKANPKKTADADADAAVLPYYWGP